jgi:hypothetical protein
MPRILIIGSEEFEFPESGDNPNWAEQVTDWAQSVTDSLQNVQQPNDVLTTSATIANNISSPTSIPGFSFDTSEVLAINGEYIIIRRTDSPSNNLVESGTITGNFDGTGWTITRRQQGDAEVEFSITAGGQVQYTSTNVTGTNYVGRISFKAKVFNQA